MNEEILRKNIKQELINIGVPIHLLGFKYLTTAILFYINNNTKDITMNDIYKEVNKRHNVKKVKAERDIRYVFQNTKDLKVDLEKFSNKSFIIYVSEKIMNRKTNEMEVKHYGK